MIGKNKVFLTYKPVHIHKEFKINNNIVTLIFYHQSPWSNFISWLVKKPKTTYLELDDLGSYFWMNCGKDKTMETIIKEMAKVFNDSYESMETRVSKFSFHLAKNQYIGFL
ncbi:MAG: PqqD family peptide modification chaperone [Fusobacteriaceae bacterium]